MPIRTAIALLAVIAASIALAGCTGSAPEGGSSQSRDAYLDAYCTGMEHHSLAQDCFNNGTFAWENSDFRAAIAGYANASMEYNDAATCYGVMAGYASGPREKEFADDLRGCAFNLSLASDDFMNAAIALVQNDTGLACDRFDEGQTHAGAGDMLLNRSIELTPGWLKALASG